MQGCVTMIYETCTGMSSHYYDFCGTVAAMDISDDISDYEALLTCGSSLSAMLLPPCPAVPPLHHRPTTLPAPSRTLSYQPPASRAATSPCLCRQQPGFRHCALRRRQLPRDHVRLVRGLHIHWEKSWSCARPARPAVAMRGCGDLLMHQMFASDVRSPCMKQISAGRSETVRRTCGRP